MKKQSAMGSSKYEFEPDKLNEDISNTNIKINSFKHELEQVIDMCYERNYRNFKHYETAVEILQGTLVEKFLEYGEKL